MSAGYAVGGGVWGKEFYGISETNLDKIKETIIEYQKSVEESLDNLCQEVNDGVVSGAVKGEELTTAIKAFVSAIKEEAKEWSTHIKQYCTAIDEVKESYSSTQTQSASLLQENTSSVSSQAERYNYGGGSSSAS